MIENPTTGQEALEKPVESPEAERLAIQIGHRAKNLFLTRQYYCSESVMLSLNQGLGGGLDENQAVGLAAPYSVAMGESGCLCGALSGAVLAVGLFSGNHGAERMRAQSRRLARELHDQFRDRFGSTCCRNLSRKVKSDSQAHRRHCAELSGWAAATAAHLLVLQFPDLLHQADQAFIAKKESQLGGMVRKILRRLAISLH